MQEQTVIDTTANLASMMERAKIMAGPEYFTCERTHTRMKKAECVRRQTEGAFVEGSFKKEVPSECRDCAQGKVISHQSLACGEGSPSTSLRTVSLSNGDQLSAKEKSMRKQESRKAIIADNERAFEKVKAECRDRKCEFWLPDGCTYQGKVIKGLCKRKYMQQAWKEKKKKPVISNQSSVISNQSSVGSNQSSVGSPSTALRTVSLSNGKQSGAVQRVLDKPVEETAPGGPIIVLDFEGIEDIYEDLEEAAREQVRTPQLQALWYVKRSLLERKVTP